ncbi:hypothetical protein KUTeg_019383 [Tegillarca granosa]|uniref:VWFA domain-containing protein n=1 Tax=Tegillarca granosa TaxID=220873 RepID=A0ABQ9EGD4_TEGGR|nr:hypothetical protein KUTeg_019383 [Tegillarca granosa]
MCQLNQSIDLFSTSYFTACVQHDIVFMVDSSQGVGPDYFLRHCVRVGIVTFSDNVYNQFYLNQYNTKAEIMNAIDHIQYHAGPRYTTEALKFASSQSFSTLHGARANVPRIGVLVTNGLSSNPTATAQMAQSMKANGIRMYTVGIGSGAHQQQLTSIASGPSSRYALAAQNFDAVNSLAYPLTYRTNSETAVMPVQKQQCIPRADIAFLIDGSGSIGLNNFHKLQSFVKNAVGQMNVGTDTVHVGVMQFSNYPRIEFPLDMYKAPKDV